MLTPFPSSDNTLHSSFAVVVVRIHELLCTARPGKYIRPTLAQILFQTINVKEPRNKIRNTQNHLLNTFQAQTHIHLTQMEPVTITY